MDNHSVSDELSAAKQRIEQLEKELQRQNEKFEGIVSHLPDPTVIFKGDGSIDSINQAALASLDKIALPLGEVGDIRHHVCFFDVQNRPIPIEEVPPVRIMRGDTLVNYRVKSKFGPDYSYIDFNGIPIRGEDGAIVYGVMSFRDTTEQVNSEEQYRFLFESMLSGAVYHDTHGTIIAVNRAAEHILGMPAADLVGKTALEAQRPPVKADGTLFLRDEHPAMVALRTGKPSQDTILGSYNPIRKEYRWVKINAVPIFHPDNTKPYKVFTVFDDITEHKNAEDALIKSEAYLRTVLNNSTDIIYSLDARTSLYEYISPSCEKMLGFTQEEAMASDLMTVRSMIHPDDRPGYEAAMAVLEETKQTEIRYRQRTKNGEYRWLSNRVTVIKDDEGRHLYRNGIVSDITEQINTGATIAKQNLILRIINEIYEKSFQYDSLHALGQVYLKLIEDVTGSAHAFIDEYGADGFLQDIATGCSALGSEAKHGIPGKHVALNGFILHELLGTPMSGKSLLTNNPSFGQDGISIPEDHPELKALLCVPYMREGKLLGVIAAINREGGYRQVEQELLEAITPTIIEVLLRKRMEIQLKEQNIVLNKQEDALIQSEARLRIVLDNSNDVTYCYNIQTKQYEYVSPACHKVLGFTPDEMMAMELETFHDMAHPDDKHIFGEWLDKILEEKGEAEIQYRQRTKGGEYHWLTNRLTIVRDEAGLQLYRNGTVRDVTERKKMEDALRESEMQLRLAAQGGDMGTYAFDIENGKVFISDELKALWGLKPDEPALLGNDLLFHGLHPDDKQEFIKRIKAANDPCGNGFIEMEYRIILSDGTVKWLLTRGQTTFSGEGKGHHPTYAAGVVMDINKRMEAESSIREISEELRNIIESTDDFIWSVDTDYRLVLFNSSFARYIQSRFKRKIKKGMLMKDMLSPPNGALWNDLYARTASDGKFLVEMKMDRGSCVMSYSFNPVYIDSQIVEITVFGKDVTERLSSEREIIRLNASLEKRVSERTEELQKSVKNLQNLSRIISHDLKEPIKEIETYAARIDKNDDVQMNANRIKKTCANMTHMIEALSKYAMTAEHKIHKEIINIKRKVTSVYNDLKTTMTNESVLQFESGLPPVCADKVLIRQVIYNLMSNAMKFSSKRELAEITVGCTEDNGFYVFCIRDNGAGFDMKYAHKLFNIFERLHTKDEFEGTGMGLAAVRNIIQDHGGRTWIKSEENVGTAVYFSLPVHNQSEN